MDWVKPIVQLEMECRRQGVFLLVDVRRRRLQLFGYNQATLNRVQDSLKGRTDEMVNFLIALATGAKGENA
jgi:hypothetical protein